MAAGDFVTESQTSDLVAAVATAVNGKAATGHTHDDRYYTEAEVDAKIATAVDPVTIYLGAQVYS